MFPTYYTFLFPTFPIILTYKQRTKPLRIHFNYPTQRSEPKKENLTYCWNIYIMPRQIKHKTKHIPPIFIFLQRYQTILKSVLLKFEIPHILFITSLSDKTRKEIQNDPNLFLIHSHYHRNTVQGSDISEHGQKRFFFEKRN